MGVDKRRGWGHLKKKELARKLQKERERRLLLETVGW